MNLGEDITTPLDQDADAAKVYSDLIQQETALEAGLRAMSELVHTTLLDFLR